MQIKMQREKRKTSDDEETNIVELSKWRKLSGDVVFDFELETWMTDVDISHYGWPALYASKAILGMHSSVFREEFVQEPWILDKYMNISMFGFERNEIIDFLNFLLPHTTPKITRKNIDHILPLAYTYKVEWMLMLCKDWLLKFIKETDFFCPSNLINWYGFAAKYTMDTFLDKIIEKLSEFEPEKVTASVVGKQYERMYRKTVQKRLIKTYYERYKSLELDMVRTNIVSYGPKEFHVGAGFGSALSADVTITIKPASELLLSYRTLPTKELIQNTTLYLWGLRFFVCCDIITRANGEQKTPFIRLVLVCEGKNGMYKKCSVWAKVMLSCKHVDTGKRKVFDKLICFQTRIINSGTKLYELEVADFLNPTAGFVVDGAVTTNVFLLVKEPVA